LTTADETVFVLVVAVAPTLTGDGCGVEEVVEVVDATCVGALVVVFTDVVEEEAGATVDVVVDELHAVRAGRHNTRIKRTTNTFFISTSPKNIG
jgi:hypothetical protein